MHAFFYTYRKHASAQNQEFGQFIKTDCHCFKHFSELICYCIAYRMVRDDLGISYVQFLFIKRQSVEQKCTNDVLATR